MSKWPFVDGKLDDADRDHPLVKLRIPVVGSFNPGWPYIAAFLNVAKTGTVSYMARPPHASALEPTDLEAVQIASYIAAYKKRWCSKMDQVKMLQRPLDVDSGCNTLVFAKYGTDDWGYHQTSWTTGPTFIPGPEGSDSRKAVGGPLTLEQAMDHRYNMHGENPNKHWADWKAGHQNIFSSKGSK
jgi:hypothetical protein